MLFLASTGGMAASCLDVFPTLLSFSVSKGKVEFGRKVNVNGTNGGLDIEVKKYKTKQAIVTLAVLRKNAGTQITVPKHFH